MPQSPEQAAAERMKRNDEVESFVIASRGAGIEPTLPRFHEHLRQKKSVPSGKPVEIIGDEDGDDGDDEEETQPVVKQTRKKFR